MQYSDINKIKLDAYNEALRIGKQVADLAIWSDDRNTVNWLNMGVNRSGYPEYSVMKLGLYSGILGMALFYAYLYKHSKDVKFKELSEASINTALKDYIHIKNKSNEDHSAFLGYAGAIYVCMHLHVIFNRPDLIKEAENLLNRIKTLLDQDTQYDVLSGNAGIIPVCLDFYELTKNKKALDIANECGEFLIEHAHKSNNQVYWKLNDPTIEKPPLTGFSHGTAGIAWTLSRLYYATKQKKYLDYALGAIEYENSVFNEKEKNWANYSNVNRFNKTETYSYSWCNGATGIGISRLKIYSLIPEWLQIKKDLYNSLDD